MSGIKIIRLVTTDIETNTYIISGNGKDAAVIDPGGNAELIEKTIKENGLTLKSVLITHGHFDHVNACAGLKKGGVTIYISKEDDEMLKDGRKASPFGEKINAFTADRFVNDGQILDVCGLKIEVVFTPGHTAGSVCFIAEDCLFSGDTLFYLSYGRTDFPTGSESDMQKSLKKLFSLNKDYRVFPGHGQETSLFFERNNNPYA